MKSLFLSFLFLAQTAFFLSVQAQMNEAYEIAGDLVREKLAQEDPNNVEIIENLNEADIIVVSGTYDHIHLVLQSMHIPFMHIQANQVEQVEFKPFHTVFVNCSTSFPEAAANKLAHFVASGGQLITTDWALKNVLEVAFPGKVAYNGHATGDEVVSITLSEENDPTVAGFVEESEEPVWWLEGFSYPIKVLDKKNVKTLVYSKELEEKYGDGSVIVRFPHGRGRVYHMISHFYLQRSEARTQKQKMLAKDYLEDNNASEEIVDKNKNSKVNYGEVQSAKTSADFVGRVIINQAKKKEKK